MRRRATDGGRGESEADAESAQPLPSFHVMSPHRGHPTGAGSSRVEPVHKRAVRGCPSHRDQRTHGPTVRNVAGGVAVVGSMVTPGAFYFTDPEGNGVELYWDRARTSWSWVHGRVEMDTLYLDPNAYLREHLTEEDAAEPPGGAQVGHVHLSVGDVDTARDFYVSTLGFDETAAFGGSAVFVSAGGYHHHMAMNVWNSRGAGPRTPALGLGRVDIVLPSTDGIGELGERLAHYGVATRDDGASVSFDDPWANRISVARA
ncbi:hypothetical protein ELQ90_04300 [Labedella phragmitis]|uniref:VOC domain-containing protein n=1 Tax=Labedella phragmitis TaxID=2498849 RepID=A0A3S4DJZ6_9MICO|nr:hypothetical protein ELQ90_04300 [Labedella phragmitis]